MAVEQLLWEESAFAAPCQCTRSTGPTAGSAMRWPQSATMCVRHRLRPGQHCRRIFHAPVLQKPVEAAKLHALLQQIVRQPSRPDVARPERTRDKRVVGGSCTSRKRAHERHTIPAERKHLLPPACSRLWRSLYCRGVAQAGRTVRANRAINGFGSSDKKCHNARQSRSLKDSHPLVELATIEGDKAETVGPRGRETWLRIPVGLDDTYEHSPFAASQICRSPRRRRHRRRRSADRGAIDDEYRHGGCRSNRATGCGPR